jgi:hypothetical protein
LEHRGGKHHRGSGGSCHFCRGIWEGDSVAEEPVAGIHGCLCAIGLGVGNFVECREHPVVNCPGGIGEEVTDNLLESGDAGGWW